MLGAYARVIPIGSMAVAGDGITVHTCGVVDHRAASAAATRVAADAAGDASVARSTSRCKVSGRGSVGLASPIGCVVGTKALMEPPASGGGCAQPAGGAVEKEKHTGVAHRSEVVVPDANAVERFRRDEAHARVGRSL